MFVRTLDDLRATGAEKRVAHDTATVVRYLNKADGLGFSFSDVRVSTGTESVLWYKNHWEANYVAEGETRLTDLVRDRTWTLTRGSLYCVGPTDRHKLEVISDARYISVFNPPITGLETHDEDGAYPPTGDIPAGQPEMSVTSVDELRAAGRELSVADGKVRSMRMLTRSDGLGFTLCNAHLDAGAEGTLWYKHHWEANYILGGTGQVEHLTSGETWPLAPGTAYMVGPDDPHRVTAATGLHIVSIFNPPLDGDEVHDGDGALPPTGPVPPGPGSAA